ncbi:MAG TPA: metalloregulator ArsR/SmtB family transcription factor [Thermoanaerobaculia bacterium]|nr:metalloregulator ArsR/SmtB family transcription factor [Thermoanaerobaculia bacterium]
MKATGDLVGMLQALGDPTRLRLLNLLRGGEICVCYFVEILGEPQPKVSRHLAYLRRAGLVDVRRDGKWMHYKLAPTAHEAVLESILDEIADDRQMRRDRLALERACCALRLPGTLQHAPRPHIES